MQAGTAYLGIQCAWETQPVDPATALRLCCYVLGCADDEEDSAQAMQGSHSNLPALPSTATPSQKRRSAMELRMQRYHTRDWSRTTSECMEVRHGGSWALLQQMATLLVSGCRERTHVRSCAHELCWLRVLRAA
jgi:hypothetical protein